MNLSRLAFSSLVLASSLFSAAAASAAAPKTEVVLVSAQQAECSKLPVVLKTVRFQAVPTRFNDSTINVVMTIDADGVPREIEGLKPMPLDLANGLVPSLAQWKFSPACDKDGKPVALRIVLPVKLVGLL